MAFGALPRLTLCLLRASAAARERGGDLRRHGPARRDCGAPMAPQAIYVCGRRSDVRDLRQAGAGDRDQLHADQRAVRLAVDALQARRRVARTRMAVSELLARVQAFALGANAAGLAVVERAFGVGSNPRPTVLRAASVGRSPGSGDAPSSGALAALAARRHPSSVTSALFMCGPAPGAAGKSGGSGRSFTWATSRLAVRPASKRMRRKRDAAMPRWSVHASNRPPGARIASAAAASEP